MGRACTIRVWAQPTPAGQVRRHQNASGIMPRERPSRRKRWYMPPGGLLVRLSLYCITGDTGVLYCPSTPGPPDVSLAPMYHFGSRVRRKTFAAYLFLVSVDGRGQNDVRAK